jgi:hypothetical protein
METMHNGRQKSTCVVIVVFTIFTLLFLGAVAPSSIQAEEPGSAPYAKKKGVRSFNLTNCYE